MMLLNRKVKMKSVQTIAEIAVKASGPHLKVFTQSINNNQELSVNPNYAIHVTT